MMDLMKEFSETIEPWFCELSDNLLGDVKGFTNFLMLKLKNMDQSCHKEKEISQKLQELLKWRKVAKAILPRKYLGANFVDSFTMNKEMFKVFNYEETVVFVLISSDYEAHFEESKCETPLNKGFIVKKCLRKVRNGLDIRDVLTAIRCDYDIINMEVVNIYEQDKFIIKRVGKILNDEIATDRYRREFKVQHILGRIEHKGINKLIAYCEDDTSIFGISEYAGDNDLLDKLQDHIQYYGESFCEERVKNLFKPAVEGLLIAHNLGIAHRDISLENLVVNSTMKKETLEIIDWGHSVSCNCKFSTNPGKFGKVRYFSPELLSGSELYDPFKSDVFSLGVCLFSSLFGEMPFSSLEDDRAQYLKGGVRNLLKYLKKEDKLSDCAIDLLNKCLEWDFEKRISMKEVLGHSFFNNRC